MDFETQRQAISAINRFSEKHKLLSPACAAAKAATAGFCSAVRFLDMSLSDSEGYFLGIKRDRKEKVRSFYVPEERVSLQMKPRGKPFGSRIVSAAAAFSFAFMILPPELAIVSGAAQAVIAVSDGTAVGMKNSSAVTYRNTIKLTPGSFSKHGISTVSDGAFKGNSGIYSVDTVSSGISDIGSEAFASCGSLTEVYVSAADCIAFGKDAFANAAPDSAVFVSGCGSKSEFEAFAEYFSGKYSSDRTLLLDDRNKVFSLSVPADVKHVRARTAPGNVLVTFRPVEEADGYGVYLYSELKGEYVKLGDFTELYETDGEKGIYIPADILGEYKGEKSFFAVRAYKNTVSSDRTEKIYSTRFSVSDKKAAASEIGDPSLCDLSLSVSGTEVYASWNRQTMKLSGNTVGEADYYKLYIGEDYDSCEFAGIYDSAHIKLPLDRPISDDDGYTAVLRAFFDPYGLAEDDNSFYGENQIYDPDRPWVEYYETTASTGGISLAEPQNLSCDFNSSDEYVLLSWNAVNGADGYLLSAKSGNGAFEDFDIGDKTSYRISKSEISSESDFEFSVQSYVSGKKKGSYIGKSRAVVCGASSPDISITGFSADASDGTVKLSWNEYAGASYYIINCIKNGTPVDTKKTDGLTAEFSNLENGAEYRFEITADNAPVNGSLAAVTAVPVTAEAEGLTFSEGKLAIADSGFLPTPVDVKAAAGNRQVTISWTEVTGSDYYEVYRYDPEQDKYRLVGAVSGTSFTDTDLQNGVKYTYHVVACFDEVDDILGTVYQDRSGKSIDVYAVPAETVTTAATTAAPGNVTTAAPGQPVQQQTTAATTAKPVQEIVPPGAPVDFVVSPGEGQAILSWTAVKGASGYQACIINSQGIIVPLEEVSKTTAVHVGLTNGNNYTYVVRAFVFDSEGNRIYGPYSIQKSVTVGAQLSTPIDVQAVSGDGEAALTWSPVAGADGYIVYSYDSNEASFRAVSVVSKPNFIHTGLVNGKVYTYMIAAYKNTDGHDIYSDYSIAVSAIPGNDKEGGNRASSYNMYVVGTTPYGLSDTEVINAVSDSLAFNTDVDVRFGADKESEITVKGVLGNYADGLDSFDIYPFDISLYVSGTYNVVEPEEGHYVTITMPVPDRMKRYGDNIQLVHITSDDKLEIIPITFGSAEDDVATAQFKVASFSPFAFVHYYTFEDLHSGSGADAAQAAESGSSAYAMKWDDLFIGYKFRRKNKVYKLIGRS